MRVCRFEECGKKVSWRGLCTGHVKQDQKGQKLRPLRKKVGRYDNAEDMFWANIGITEECWYWLGDKNNKGYGDLKHHSGRWLAHRFSYLLHKGQIPSGLVIDHMCHTTDCANPDHLRAITQKQNMEHRTGAQTNSTTGVRGVSPTASGRFRARIKDSGVELYLGVYDTVEEAERVVIAKRLEIFTHSSYDK